MNKISLLFLAAMCLVLLHEGDARGGRGGGGFGRGGFGRGGFGRGGFGRGGFGRGFGRWGGGFGRWGGFGRRWGWGGGWGGWGGLGWGGWGGYGLRGWGFGRWGLGYPYLGAYRPWWSMAAYPYYGAGFGSMWNTFGYPLTYPYYFRPYHYIVTRDTEKMAAKMDDEMKDPIQYSCEVTSDRMSCVWPKGKLNCDLTQHKMDKSWKMDKTHMTMKYVKEGNWIDLFAHDHKTGVLNDYTFMADKTPVQWSMYWEPKVDRTGFMFKDIKCFNTFVSMANTTAWDDFELTVTV